MNKQDAYSMCLVRLHKMNTFLGTNYSSPIDIGLNQITKNWTDFFKLHFKHTLKDGFAILRGEHAFLMKLQKGKQIIDEVEKGFESITKA